MKLWVGSFSSRFWTYLCYPNLNLWTQKFALAVNPRRLPTPCFQNRKKWIKKKIVSSRQKFAATMHALILLQFYFRLLWQIFFRPKNFIFLKSWKRGLAPRRPFFVCGNFELESNPKPSSARTCTFFKRSLVQVGGFSQIVVQNVPIFSVFPRGLPFVTESSKNENFWGKKGQHFFFWRTVFSGLQWHGRQSCEPKFYFRAEKVGWTRNRGTAPESGQELQEAHTQKQTFWD